MIKTLKPVLPAISCIIIGKSLDDFNSLAPEYLAQRQQHRQFGTKKGSESLNMLVPNWCQMPNYLGAAFSQEHCLHKGKSNYSILNFTGLYLFDSDTIPLCLNPIWSVQFLPLASAFMQVKYQFEHTRILQNLKICKY